MQAQESTVEIETLQSELYFYRQNDSFLEEETKKLIEDNTRLSHQVETLLRDKAERAGLHTCNIDLHKQLQHQISLLTKENDSLQHLWQTSQGAIEALETELKTYQNEFTRASDQQHCESKLDVNKNYKTALEQLNELENRINKGNKRETDLEAENKEYTEKVKDLEKKITELSQELEKVRAKANDGVISNEHLQKQLEHMRLELKTAQHKETEAKLKVQEALSLLDIVTEHKEEALMRTAAVTEELNFLKVKTGEAAGEIENRLRTELDEVKENYDEKISDMLQHVQTLDAELVNRGLQLVTTLRENQILKRANETFEKLQADVTRSADPRLAIAEQKLEAAFQELVLSERRNIRLVSEKQTLTLEFQRQRDEHTRDEKRRCWEISLLQTELSDYKLQIEHLQKSLQETDAMVEKLQTLLSANSYTNMKMVSSKDEEVTALNEHVLKQIELNKKWRESYLTMTEELRKRLEELHEENKKLKELNIHKINLGSEYVEPKISSS